MPSEEIDELLGASRGPYNVREDEGLEDLVFDGVAAAHVANCFGC